jgi:hypothetical protein
MTWLGIRETAGIDSVIEATARATAAEHEVEHLREALADVERAMDDAGWTRLTANAGAEFSREGLRRGAEVARVMAVVNPLIKRGLGIRQAYVWGQGCQVQARATGQDGTQDVNRVVQAFMDDQGNRAAVFGDQAQEELERALGTDGNVFIAAFTSPLTGFVQVRSVPFDEVADVVTNPDDRDDPWFFKRVWVETTVDTATAATVTRTRTAYHPATTYRPAARLRSIDGHEVLWDAPIYQVSVNRLDGWKFGVGDAYAALPWARSYRDFLADWATLVKALSQFAWRASTKKAGRAQQLRERIQRRPTAAAADGNPNSVGATAVTSDDVTLEAIPKTGATIDSESGRPLAAMVAAALDIPVTVLLADPGQTGARAVAETLQLPTRLAMQQRQSLWAQAYRSLFDYLVRSAVRAPRGPLQGAITRDPFTGREVVVLAGDTDASVEVTFPSLEEDVPVAQVVEAIVKADSTGKLPPLEVARLLLQALGVKDIDEVLGDLTDDDGRWLDPLVSAGQAAVDAYRRGTDPAALVGTGTEEDA